MEPFPHLKLVQSVTGRARLRGGGAVHPTSDQNRANRGAHSTSLLQTSSLIKSDWEQSILSRDSLDLAPLDSEIVPVFLQMNPDLLNVDFDLQAFGIEIISEEENGFIIGASLDNLRSLEDKISDFALARHGSGKIADLWQIISGNREEWKKNHILSPSLLRDWAKIRDDDNYRVEVSVAFDKPLGPEPDPSKQGGLKRLEKYREKLIERDDLLMERESHFDDFIAKYGQRLSDIIHMEDSFGCEVQINGIGLKDLVVNYPFVFEVNEVDEISGTLGGDPDSDDSELEVESPSEGAPIVGLIDSGLMENHRYLELAIDEGNSKSYVSGDNSTVDKVKSGGHGTRVAGAILYPLGISGHESPYQLPCFLRNLRVLNDENSLEHRYPAELIRQIVEDNEDCHIFNLSINSKQVHRRRHMSTWAAWIDYEIFSRNKMFIISAGNLTRRLIAYYITNGLPYPDFLQQRHCGIANPGQSCFAITVGSINHSSYDDQMWGSLGTENDVSAFSRIGPGIWDTIKPDVVEFGGGLLLSKNGQNRVSQNAAMSPELLRSTLHGGGANGSDTVGTSYAAPKVTHIVSALKKLYPDETVNLLRALVVQGARLPGRYFENPTALIIRHLGYGLPSLDRVVQNTDHRVSFYNTGEIHAEDGHIYSLKIPESLRSPGDEFNILIEVTLAFTANVRRTRQKIKSYLSTWLSWDSSKLEEQFDSFKEYALKEIENTATIYDSKKRGQLESIPWKIGDRSNSGIDNVSRSKNTIQKDWAVIKSYQLPEELGFVITGHKGWDKDKEAVPYALVVSIEILGQDIPIYEVIKIENEVEAEAKSGL